jgi:GAF domain-containing protein
MKKRSRAGGEPIKGRRRKTPEPKRRNAPRAVPRSKSSKSSPPGEEKVARLTRERDEALEQQTATGDVLKIISRPSFDLQAVLDTLIKLAARLCEADLVAIHRPRDGAMQFAANFGLPQEWVEIIKRTSIVPGRGTATGRVLLTGKAVQIADVEADPEYTFSEGQRAGGFRTVLAVPLEREGETIGVIVLCRTKVHPFTDKQIALVTNFAAQAVIAIENARLLNELRQRTTELTERTADLTEALEQQTATSEVLQVISGSPGDLEPVFASMLENAVRICDATFGNIYRWNGELSNLVASHNTPPALVEARRRLRIHFVPKDLVGQAIANKKAVHIADLAEHQDYIERSSPGAVAAVELGGVRTHVVVPMMKDDELIGTFHLSRQEVRPFTDKQIELVTNFAAQAVIAIENTRLLKELRERTVEVEKLNQQLEKRVADQVGEIERMGRLRRFLPPQVADLIVASGAEKQLAIGER